MVTMPSTKSSYSSWIRYFDEGEGRNIGLTLEALLVYWLSWFIFLSGSEDSLNGYVLPLVNLLAKGKKVALAPIYLGSLYARLDECVANETQSLGRYDVYRAWIPLFANVTIGAFRCSRTHTRWQFGAGRGGGGGGLTGL